MEEKPLSQYLTEFQSIGNANFPKKIKIALLSSFTTQGLKETLAVKCAALGIGAEFYTASYNSYQRELLDAQSGLADFQPNLTFLILDIRSIFKDFFFFPYRLGEQERKECCNRAINEIFNLTNVFLKNYSGKLILANLPLPVYSPLGIIEEKTPFSLKDMAQMFNSGLKKEFLPTERLFIYDFNGFVSYFGGKNIFDYKLYFLADVQVNFSHLPALAEELMGFVKAEAGLAKKCLVLDLDNTLWGGIVGEDSFENIKLGPESPSNVFWEFQKYILALNQRGIILAVNSKNNPEDALRVIREHPYMVLREEHFACLKINWQDKATNLKEIANELNIGLDSLVFIDDDPLNRQLVKERLPEVLVVDLPDDPSYFTQTLKELNEFNVFQITEEDYHRGRMYTQDRQRKEFEVKSGDFDEFLAKLNLKVEIKKADAFTVPRISQLTLKTNQFNLTTRRYQEEEIRRFAGLEDYLVFSVKVEDKFGDSGIVGVAIIKKMAEGWLIDNFLLSCRIIGRNIEKAMLYHIIDLVKKDGAQRVVGEYIATAKNAPCSKMYEENGFDKAKDGLFVFETNKSFLCPEYIEMIIN